MRGLNGAARLLVAAGLAILTAACAAVPVEIAPQPVAVQKQSRPDPVPVRPDWRPLFDDVSHGAILINIKQRWLIYWEPGARKSHAFPIAVPMTDELTRTGLTKVVRRKKGPDWRATPSMIERNPEVPRYIPPGPHNPLGEYAIYLGWQYFAIHGTNTPGVIGDRVTSGCFRLFGEDIEWLFENVPDGAPVLVVEDIDVQPVPEREIGVSGRPSGELGPDAEGGVDTHMQVAPAQPDRSAAQPGAEPIVEG